MGCRHAEPLALLVSQAPAAGGMPLQPSRTVKVPKCSPSVAKLRATASHWQPLAAAAWTPPAKVASSLASVAEQRLACQSATKSCWTGSGASAPTEWSSGRGSQSNCPVVESRRLLLQAVSCRQCGHPVIVLHAVHPQLGKGSVFQQYCDARSVQLVCQPQCAKQLLPGLLLQLPWLEGWLVYRHEEGPCCSQAVTDKRGSQATLDAAGRTAGIASLCAFKADLIPRVLLFCSVRSTNAMRLQQGC